MLPAPTQRLQFRPMVDEDVADIATLDTAGSRGPQGWIAWNQRNYAEHGFGLWVIETHDGAFVGDAGLTLQEVDGVWRVEAGWHVRADLQRQGFASEAAAAVRDAAAAEGMESLIAIIRPDNVASQGVATKLGMTWEREIFKLGGPAFVYSMALPFSGG